MLYLFRGFTGLQGGNTVATYGYCRVSTVKQANEGESLAVQKRAMGGYAMQHGLKLDKIFVERAASGSTPLAKRPQGAELLAPTRRHRRGAQA